MPHGSTRLVHASQANETAGDLAVTDCPIFDQNRQVADFRSRLRSSAWTASDLVILIDATGRYRGAVTIQAILVADDRATLSSLVQADWPTVGAATDQEHAVTAAIRAGVAVLPVVGADARPVGLLSAHTLIEILGKEHREDVDRLVGMLKEQAGARRALEEPPLKRVRRRLPWLVVGLVLSAATAAVMAGFEATLKSNVMIAVFIPAIVYLADAIGTQSEAIAIRGLSVRHHPLARILLEELATGALIGLVLGTLAFVAIALVVGNASLGLGVAIALVAAGAIASSIGLLLPWSLSRIGIDPAFGAGPVATIVQDFLTILVYFVVMTRLVDVAP